jgi:hypothetical protein
MTRTMYDAIAAKATNIPRSAQLVAGYVDGLFAWGPPQWGLFPDSVHVGIATSAFTNQGQVLDVENGAATPAQAPAWCHMRRAAGQEPTVYCSLSNWDTCKAAFASSELPEPSWWVADYTLQDGPIPAGAVALQWTDNPPDNPYDTSLVEDYWPGVDPPLQEEQMGNIQAVIVTLPAGAPQGPGEAQYLLVPDPGYKVWIDQESLPGLLAIYPPPGGVQQTISAEFAARIPTLGPEAPGYSGTPYVAGGGAAAASTFQIALSGTASS